MDQDKVKHAVVEVLRGVVNKASLIPRDHIQDEITEQGITRPDVLDMNPEIHVDELLKDEDVQALCKIIVRDILYKVKDTGLSSEPA